MKTENRNGLLAVSAAADEIDRVRIVQLGGLTLGEWYAAQGDKPDMLINGSLWDERGAIGTIWQDGTLVRDEGNGFGFGVTAAGAWGMSDPWSVHWCDYITGYPGLVKGGEPLSHAVDDYVMNRKTRRSVVAVAGDRLYFITAANMNIPELRQALVAFGAYSAINLDGGGSSRLLVNGRAVNDPTDDRRCPNAVAVWLKQKEEEKPMGKIKAAIDAGHGRHTPGKRCAKALDPGETREWMLNSRIAEHVCRHLKASGVDVLRVDDTTGETDVTLAERVRKANEADCAVYVSIHADSGIDGGTGGGMTCFCYTNASKKAFELRDAIYENAVEMTGLRGNRGTPKTTADFYVLRHTKMPAALIECGFMDSKTDVPIILTDEFAEKAALGIAQGICETLGVKMAQAEEKPTQPAEIPSAWARESWAWAAENKIMDGTRPHDAVTREELAAVLHRMKGV